MENDFTKLKIQVDELSRKLDMFLDIYYRTNMIDRTDFINPVIFQNNITFGKNGTKIGTSTSDKLAFYNATPIVQPSTITDPTGGATVDSQARTAIGTIIDRLQSLGLIA